MSVAGATDQPANKKGEGQYRNRDDRSPSRSFAENRAIGFSHVRSPSIPLPDNQQRDRKEESRR
jgi:hypothetical protein